ncbi:hypothetical protein C8Q76DRAFT_802441 [Earliella scabrosa]|nr:hypothetical protein C8Q76DRAFT_802441 [Earliella scabrosa]
MPADPRVKALVDRHLPSDKALKEVLHDCHMCATHYCIVSYGGTTRETVGQIYERCAYQTGCRHDWKPLGVQLTRSSLQTCLSAIGSLNPPPYGDEKFVHWCLETAIELNRGVVTPQSADECVFLTAPSRNEGHLGFGAFMVGLGGRRRSIARPHGEVKASTSVRKRPPVLPQTVEVPTFVFRTDGSPAKPIVLQGVCHGHLVLVNVRQDAMFDALGLPRTARGLALKLEFWEIWEGSWVPGLPDGDKIPLLPEQGLIIRKAGVTRCLELDRCEASTKPRCLTSDRTRLPSLLRPSVELSSSSLAHRKEPTTAATTAPMERPVHVLPRCPPPNLTIWQMFVWPKLGQYIEFVQAGDGPQQIKFVESTAKELFKYFGRNDLKRYTPKEIRGRLRRWLNMTMRELGVVRV